MNYEKREIWDNDNDNANDNANANDDELNNIIDSLSLFFQSDLFFNINLFKRIVAYDHSVLNYRDSDDNTILMIICSRLHIKDSDKMNLISYILDMSPKTINMTNYKGETALHICCRLKIGLDIIKLLYSKGMRGLYFYGYFSKLNMNIVNKLGETPLLLLCKNFKNDFLVFNTFKMYNSEIIPMFNHYIELIKFLIYYGADTHFRDSEGSLFYDYVPPHYKIFFVDPKIIAVKKYK